MRLKHFVSMFFMLFALSVGQVWGEETELFSQTFPGSPSAYTNSYTSSFTLTTSGNTLTYRNINNGQASNAWTAVRAGRNNSNASVATITSGQISDAVSKVSITFTQVNASNTNELCLEVASNASFTSATKITKTIAASTIEFPITSPAANKYYRIKIDLKAGSSNGFTRFSEVKFYTEEEEEVPSFTITPQSNNTSLGTVSLTGTTITATPTTGNRVSTSEPYSVSPANSATVAQNGNAFTVTPSANTTVTINFEAIPTHTISFNTGELVTIPSVTGVEEGDVYTITQTPAASLTANCEFGTFVGWTTETTIANENTCPAIVSNVTMGTSDVTLHAVYSKTVGGNGGAPVGTVMFSENWTGVTNSTQPTSPTTDGSTVYNNATVTYEFHNGTTTTQTYTSNGPNGNENVLISKGSGYLGIHGIPTGKATELSVSYAKSGSGTVVLGWDTEQDVSVSYGTVYVGENVTSFSLYIGNSSTSDNFRLDDIVVTVSATDAAGTTTYSMDANCCTPYAIALTNNGTVTGQGTFSADMASACAGATVTMTFTPNPAYHLKSWSVNGTEQDVNDNTFTMPAEAVTVSATFEHDPCTQLDEATNIVISGTAYPYNAVTLTWDAVTNANYYVVEIGSGNNINTSDHLTETTFTVPTTLAANTQYEYRVYAYPNPSENYCYSMENGYFTTSALPTAHLTLNDANGTHASSGDYTILTPFNLPSTAASCSKAFIGWDSDENCATAPTYAKGAEFTFTNTTDVTLYAVYATETVNKVPGTLVAYDGLGGRDALTALQYVTAHGLGTDYAASNSPYLVKFDTEGDYIQFSLDDAPTSITFAYKMLGGANTSHVIIKECATADGTYSQVESLEISGAQNSTGLLTTTQTFSEKYVRMVFNKGHNVGLGAITVSGLVSSDPVLSDYTTSCTASPEAVVVPEEINATSVAVANGVIDVTYSHVNTTNVAVALFNNQACTEAFTGEWLTASLNNDNDIAYTIAENTSYNDVRTAYIKLTAPETNGATDPAVVVIPVTQAKKPAVFASLEELVAADVNANTNVTVTFSDVTIKEMYEYNDKVCGVVFDIQKDNADIKIYFNNQETITDWVPGGTLSGTLTDCPWKTYSSAWQLAPANNSGWAWANLTYEEPATVSSVVVEGNPIKTEYIDGQTFSPAGLTVTVNYSNSTSQVNPVGVTFSQHVLTQGTTSINVVASYNNVSSDEYEVTGLTVNPIPNKTINEFITAEGTRCYLEGVVSNYSNKTKGYFNLTDATGTIYIYGCTSPSSFDAGDKVKVLAEVYEYYQSTTHEAKNVQYVSKVPAATITIANKIMEVGDEPWTIEATTDPEGAASHLSYSIKAGSDDCITLSEGVVTATAQGTATIIASVQDGDDYMANSVEFTVTVNPAAVHTNVVIYAYYGGHYYALTNAVEALEFTVNNNKIIVHNDAEKDAIIWDHAVRGTEHTFYNAASGKYLKGSTSTTLTASTGATGDHYIWQEYANGAYLTTTATAQTVRTILYRNGYGFKNYDVENAGASGYANPGITTAEVIVDEQVVRDGLTPGKYGTICLEKNVVSFTGATMYSIDSKASDLSYITLEEETGALEAGRPYIFLATGSEIKVQYGTTVAQEAGDYNGLVGSFTREQLAEGMYIIQNNKFYRTGADNYVGEHKAYIDMTYVPEETTLVPGRRYVTMQIGNVQTPTALEETAIEAENAKFILNGQLYILRDGKLYNAQGQLVK